MVEFDSMKKTLLVGLCMMLFLVGLVAASDYYLNDTNNGGNESSTTVTNWTSIRMPNGGCPLYI